MPKAAVHGESAAVAKPPGGQVAHLAPIASRRARVAASAGFCSTIRMHLTLEMLGGRWCIWHRSPAAALAIGASAGFRTGQTFQSVRVTWRFWYHSIAGYLFS
jgi:hypothetical protein